MIEVWSLPGPAALVARIAAELADGRQCIPVGDTPHGFRRAVEDALAAGQIRLRVVYDDQALDPSTLMRREAEAPGPDARLPDGVWWVDGVTAERSMAWSQAVHALGEAMRHDPPHRRALLVLPLPPGSPPVPGLDIAWLQAEALGRLDLEVAARYAAAVTDRHGVRQRLRVELAVEMASLLLPASAALEALGRWMEAPEEALCEPACFAAHARANGVDAALPALELWRVHHAVLLREIENERLAIVRANRHRWRMPYDAPEADGRPAKRIEAPEMLELKHLCRQLRQRGEPLQSPLLLRLEALRELRNSLSHLEHAWPADVMELDARTP